MAWGYSSVRRRWVQPPVLLTLKIPLKLKGKASGFTALKCVAFIVLRASGSLACSFYCCRGRQEVVVTLRDREESACQRPRVSVSSPLGRRPASRSGEAGTT